jgi:predicted metal-dependent peptidase
MEIEERIEKAKIKIIIGNPFFAYLTYYLPIAEDKQGLIDEYGGMCVTQDDKIYYKPKYVESIDDEQLIFSILHEVGHRAFLHIERGEGKAHFKWNVAIDLMINTLLKNNGFKPPKGVLLPDDNDQFNIMGKVIDKISHKSAEEIYDELPEIPEPKTRKIYVFFDNHIKGKEGQDGKGTDGKPNNPNNRFEVSSSEANKIEQEWLNRVQRATIEAKQRGIGIAGIERFVEDLSKVEIPWQTKLRKYIQNTIPNDYSWMSPMKKYFSIGYYLPNLLKEKIEVVISIDVSGSIDTPQYSKFISEVISMARTYRERINMKIFFHDVKMTAEYKIDNGDIPKIRNMKIIGGGGTCFDEIIKEMAEKKNYKNTKCLIWFTDGEGNEITTERNFPILWVLSKNGTDRYISDPRDSVIKLKLD